MGLHILMATDFYAPFIGGTEHQVQVLSKNLLKRGHRVSVATVHHAGLAEEENDEGVAVHRLKGVTTSVSWFSTQPGRRFHPPFPDPGIVNGLRHLLNQEKPDVLHAHGWIAYSAALAVVGKKTPLVLSVRDYGYGCATRNLLYKGEICSGPAPRKCFNCASGMYGRAKAAVAVGSVFGGKILLRHKVTAGQSISNYVKMTFERDLKSDLREDKGPFSIWIRDILDLDLHKEDGQEELYSSYLAQLPAEPFILFAGALRPLKGIDTLLEAYSRLENPPPLVLMGTAWDDTPETFPPGVLVLHDFPHAAVMLAWERCLFAVAPSRWPEPLGGVILEAMSKSKAVISTNTGGPLDLILDGESGFLVPPGDASALSTVLKELITNTVLRSKFELAGRERVKAYEVEAVLPEFEKLYERVSR